MILLNRACCFILPRALTTLKSSRVFLAGTRRAISDDNNPNNKELNDQLINEWREGIKKREAEKRQMEQKQRDNFIEEKKRQLEELQQKQEQVQPQGNKYDKPEAERDRSELEGNDAKIEDTTKKEKENPSHKENVIEDKDTKADPKNVAGAYQLLIDKIKENENFQQLKEELHKFTDAQKKNANNYKQDLSERLKNNAEDLKKTFPIIVRIINELTGYTRIEKLKADITAKENLIQELKLKIKDAKQAYNSSVHLRSQSQKQINELLQRQNSWSLEDLEKFTNLYKNDHTLEKQEQENLKMLQELESQQEENQSSLMTVILTRYHEEQVWSDKIRRFSTWGTLLIMGVNLFLFIIVQLVFEPWKRRRLVNSFEAKVKDMLANDQILKQPVSLEEITATPSEVKPVSDLDANDTDKAINQIPEATLNNTKDSHAPDYKIEFSLPNSDQNSFWTYCKELFSMVGRNISKIIFIPNIHFFTNNFKGDAFIDGRDVLLSFDKIQLNVILILNLILGIGIGRLLL
ncbi:hypothetical protein PACTADRAFT_49214 [Pachysolen tannophilus NRRL Y-2460]|uniref:Sensitive to high expression protein 9, mitochondrial n=1 Tax=Pachysolen tannophilus NRRL Y-2460 TaxID=669874 RepID=A0A1E4TVJ6_PACTA|nr:hypothetical protein PACTADRAFT_49214 [Pachysolen tannophilus NRRL Y-2460]